LLLLRSAEARYAPRIFSCAGSWLSTGAVSAAAVDPTTRVIMALLAGRFDWRGALVVVQPATMVRWHRAG
jgi:hypothetical protein